MNAIRIERLLTTAQHDQAVELQKHYWGADASNLVPRHMLFSISHFGGHILGAYDGKELVGFVIGFVGTDIDVDDRDARPAMANLLIMSKRMLVLPAYRGQNIGYRLKMAQRDIAMKQAIRLVTWTVDPLLAANAHLNIRKLGAVIQRFSANYFRAGRARKPARRPPDRGVVGRASPSRRTRCRARQQADAEAIPGCPRSHCQSL